MAEVAESITHVPKLNLVCTQLHPSPSALLLLVNSWTEVEQLLRSQRSEALASLEAPGSCINAAASKNLGCRISGEARALVQSLPVKSFAGKENKPQHKKTSSNPIA